MQPAMSGDGWGMVRREATLFAAPPEPPSAIRWRMAATAPKWSSSLPGPSPWAHRRTNRWAPTGKARNIRSTSPSPFALGKYAVTFEEYGPPPPLADKPMITAGRGRRPVIEISWDAPRAIAAGSPANRRRLSPAVGGMGIRLPGHDALLVGARDHARSGLAVSAMVLRPRSRQKTEQVDPNPWGLYQMHGNVGRRDQWRLGGAPTDGSARATRGNLLGQVSWRSRHRVARGGSAASRFTRAAFRGVEPRPVRLGFRCARDLGEPRVTSSTAGSGRARFRQRSAAYPRSAHPAKIRSSATTP